MNEVNFEIIKNNKLPSSYLNDSRFKEFYILTHKSNPSNINADIIFQTEDFKLLKFKNQLFQKMPPFFARVFKVST